VVTHSLRLADSILALHEQILEVYVMEERDGQNVITDEASRSGASFLADGMSQMGRNAPLSPSIILGAASQILQGSRPTRLVGVLYQGGGVILSPIDENSLVLVSTTPSSLFEVMQKITDFLPRITRRGIGGMVNAVNSASEAEEKAIAFLTRGSRHLASIRIHEVAYVNTDRVWNVNGSIQSRIRRKKFHLEVEGQDGSIVKFSSPDSMQFRKLLLIEFTSIVAAAILLVWILYSKL
jgi:hypothetical protein